MRMFIIAAFIALAAQSGVQAIPFTVDGSTLYISNGSVGISTNAPAGLFTVGSATMVITNDGKVGLGTGNPVAGLEVVSGLKIDNGPNSTTPSLNAVGNQTSGQVVVVNNSGNVTDYTGFYNGSTVGSITRNGGTGVLYNTTSDKRLKTNIRPGKHGLSDLMRIDSLDFEFKKEPKRTVNGFIAEDVYKIYPDAVHVGGSDPNADPWGVDYGRLTPLLLQAIKDQQSEIEELKAEIKLLKK